MTPTWIILPVMTGMEMTRAAISDALAQSVPTRLLLVNQGCPDDMRDEFERLAEEQPERVFVLHHMPPLPSLSATWNRCLDLAWETGGEAALVVNFDVRLAPDTVEMLAAARRACDALFVSAVGVTGADFRQTSYEEREVGDVLANKGGPDFSCFLISKACHDRFRFDEGFIPAFAEDLDMHRRLMLAGEGQRIFSVNLPFLHHASQTLKLLPPKEADRIRREIDTISRAHYRAKWGGDVNAETFLVPFGHASDCVRTDGSAATPYLFDQERQQWASALRT